jgi:hypothetical protein
LSDLITYQKTNHELQIDTIIVISDYLKSYLLKSMGFSRNRPQASHTVISEEPFRAICIARCQDLENMKMLFILEQPINAQTRKLT